MLERQTNREVETVEEENIINQICSADERVQVSYYLLKIKDNDKGIAVIQTIQR